MGIGKARVRPFGVQHFEEAVDVVLPVLGPLIAIRCKKADLSKERPPGFSTSTRRPTSARFSCFWLSSTRFSACRIAVSVRLGMTFRLVPTGIGRGETGIVCWDRKAGFNPSNRPLYAMRKKAAIFLIIQQY